MAKDLTDKDIENHKVIGAVDAPIFFDVDNTLIMHKWPEELNGTEIVILDKNLTPFTVVPHQHHIKRLLQHYNKGSKIYVWSQAGEEWAKVVIEHLCLEKYVTACMTKPAWIYDDIPINIWCSEEYRIYLDVVDGTNCKVVNEPDEYAMKQRDLTNVLWKQLCKAKAELAHLQAQIKED